MTEEAIEVLITGMEALVRKKIRKALNWAKNFENGDEEKSPSQIATLVLLDEVLLPFYSSVGETLCTLAHTDSSIITWLSKSYTFLEDDIYKLFETLKNSGKSFEVLNVYSLNNKYEIMQRAASYGDEELIEWMLRNSIDVDFRDTYQQTALHLACEHGRKDLVEFLLKEGASPFAVDSHANTPFLKAFDASHFDIAELLPQSFLDQNYSRMLLLAVCRGEQKQVEYLLGKMYYTDIISSALRCAAGKGYLAIVESILSKSIYLITDCHLALSLAVKNNYPKVVEKLLAYGAVPDQEIVDIALKKNLRNVKMIEAMRNFYVSTSDEMLLHKRSINLDN